MVARDWKIPALWQRISQRLREHGVGPTLRKAFADFIFRASTSVILEYRRGDHRVGANAEIPAWLSFMVLRDGDTVPPLCDWMAHRRDAFGAMLANGKPPLATTASCYAACHRIVCYWKNRSANELRRFVLLTNPSARTAGVLLSFQPRHRRDHNTNFM
jgi:hypothetical protein